MRRQLIAYALVCSAAALGPLLAAGAGADQPRSAFPGWPSELDGRPLVRLPDSAQEAAFYAENPVRHARFSNGERVVLMSWAGQEIGAFHLASVCLRSFGFALGRPETRTGADGRRESCFYARRAGLAQRVCEHIRDGQNRVFDSEPSFHLARLLGATKPPYLGVSVVELAPGS